MLDAFKYGLHNLFNLEGRDARQTFWYFVLLIFIVRFVLGMIVAVPMVVAMFRSVFEAVRNNADPETMSVRMFGAMADTMPQMMWAGIVISVVTGVLVLPSLVRRLHDSDLCGWWAALPAALYVAGLAQAPEQMRRAMKVMVTMDPSTSPNQLQMMQTQGIGGLLAYAALGLVIYAGVRKSTDGPNRYGDAPVSF